MKVAVIQMGSSADKERNIDKALSLVKRAVQKGAEFVCLPEVFVYRGDLSSRARKEAVAEPIPGPATNLFAGYCKEKGFELCMGSIYEKIKNKKKVFNSSVMVSAKGSLKAVYRKQHLFDAVIKEKVIKESKTFLAGKKDCVTQVAGFKIGMSICYDLRFPLLYQRYARQGCHVLLAPSCFTRETGRAHWEILLRARAVETLSYVIAPNQVGQDSKGVVAYGNSLIVSPWGDVLARAAGDKEEIIYGQIDKRAICEARAKLLKIKGVSR